MPTQPPKPKTDRVTVRIASDLREWAQAKAYNLTALINRLLRQEKDKDNGDSGVK